MKRLTEENINTPNYLDDKELFIDFRNTLRQDEYLKQVKKGDTVIEIGCGTSPFVEMACMKGALSCGVDHNKRIIDFMNKKGRASYFEIKDIDRFSLLSFDVVVAGELIEHFERPQDLVDQMVGLIKKGGKMVLSTPILEFGDPEHVWQLEENDFEVLFGKYGKVETYIIESKKFKGRSYIFAIITKNL